MLCSQRRTRYEEEGTMTDSNITPNNFDGFTDAEVPMPVPVQVPTAQETPHTPYPPAPDAYTTPQSTPSSTYPAYTYMPPVRPALTDKQKHTRLLVEKILGWACIVVLVGAMLISSAMYATDTLPEWSYTFYTHEQVEEMRAQDAEMMAAGKYAWNTNTIAASRKTAMSNIVMWFGGLPSIALFIAWFCLCLSNRSAGVNNHKTSFIVKRTVLFVIGGFIFVWVGPSLATGVINGWQTLLTCAILVACLVICVKTPVSGGATSVPSTPSLGGNALASVGKKKFNKMTRKKIKGVNSNLDRARNNASIKVIDSHIRLFSHEGMTGKFVACGAPNDVHYVCDLGDWQSGKVVIMDEKGRVRSVPS